MKYISQEEIKRLEEKAFLIRKLSLEMIVNANWGHIGGSFSEAEILACLYFYFMNVNPEDPYNENRDYFILSKAHASPALYAALYLKGFLSKEKIYEYCKIGGLDGHTNMLETPGIEYSGGSLGLGLSWAAGIAYGLALKEKFNQRVYCLLGDGELNEGNIWEACLFATHYKLDNLIVIVDYNKVSAKGFIKDIMSLEPLSEKWKAFGWNVIEIDGHDVKEICTALYKAKYELVNGKPNCIIAHTVKGKGLTECEFNYKWHTHAPNLEKAKIFLYELYKNYEKEFCDFERIPEKIEEDNLEFLLQEES